MRLASANRDFVASRLAAARASLVRLDGLRAAGGPDSLQDPDRFAIAEHHLRRALECALDVARHLLAKNAVARPATYPEMMDGLERLQALPAVLARQMRDLAEHRNRLVHLGPEVTPGEVWDLMTGPMSAVGAYCDQIERFLALKPS